MLNKFLRTECGDLLSINHITHIEKPCPNGLCRVYSVEYDTTYKVKVGVIAWALGCVKADHVFGADGKDVYTVD